MKHLTPEQKARLSPISQLILRIKQAHRAVGMAVKDGVLVRPSQCSRCGDGGRIAGHHADYHRPLEVEWLCGPCHRDLHKRDGTAVHRARMAERLSGLLEVGPRRTMTIVDVLARAKGTMDPSDRAEVLWHIAQMMEPAA